MDNGYSITAMDISITTQALLALGTQPMFTDHGIYFTSVLSIPVVLYMTTHTEDITAL